jgi:hypothetical protein
MFNMCHLEPPRSNRIFKKQFKIEALKSSLILAADFLMVDMKQPHLSGPSILQ